MNCLSWTMCIAVAGIVLGGCTVTQKATHIGERIDYFRELESAWATDDQVTLVYETSLSGDRLVYALRWSTVRLDQIQWIPLEALNLESTPFSMAEIRRWWVPSAPQTGRIAIHAYDSETDLRNGLAKSNRPGEVRSEGLSAHILRRQQGKSYLSAHRVVLDRPNPAKPGSASFALVGVPWSDHFNELWAYPARAAVIPFAFLADAVLAPLYFHALLSMKYDW